MSKIKQIQAIVRATPYFSVEDSKKTHKYCTTQAYQGLDHPVEVYYSFSEANVIKIHESSDSSKIIDGKKTRSKYKLESPSSAVEKQVEQFILDIESVANLKFIKSDQLVANKINIAITGAMKGSQLLSSDYIGYTTYSKSKYLGAAIVIRYINDKNYAAEVLSDIKHQILLSLCESHPTFEAKHKELKYRSLVEDQKTSTLHKECINSKESEKLILQCVEKHHITANDLSSPDSKKVASLMRCQEEKIDKSCIKLPKSLAPVDVKHLQSMFGLSTKKDDPTNFRAQFIKQYATKEFMQSEKYSIIIPGEINFFDKPIEHYCEDYFSEKYDDKKCLSTLLLHTVKKDQQYQEELEEIEWNEDPEYEDKKSIREEHHVKIKAQYSMHNQCPSKSTDLSVIDRFMVNAYFKTNDRVPEHKYNIATNLYKIASSNQILYDVLLGGAVSSFIKASPFNLFEIHEEIFRKSGKENFIPVNERPLEIVFTGESLGKYSHQQDTNTKVMGYSSSAYNRIVFRSEDDSYEIDYTTIFHELVHDLMRKALKNYTYPYKNSEEDKFWDILGYQQSHKDSEAFENATIKVLQNVLTILKDKFNFNFSFSSEDKSTVMGAELANLLMYNSINKNNIHKFIEYFSKHDLDITQKHDWLASKNAFTHVFYSQDIDAIEILLKNTSLKISDTALIDAANMDKKHILEWLFNQDITLDVNVLSSEGKTALTLAKDPEVIKLLFEAGSVAYHPIHYQDTCPERDYRFSPEIENLRGVIKSILMSFTPAYSEFSTKDYVTITSTSANSELIARFVETLANIDNINPLIEQIIEPYHSYWDEFLAPEIQKYFAQFDAKDYCLPLIDTFSLYSQLYD